MIEPKLVEEMVNIGYALPPYSKIALISGGIALALSFPYFSRSFDRAEQNREGKRRSLSPVRTPSPPPQYQPFAPTFAYITPTGNITTNRRLVENRRVNLGNYLDRKKTEKETIREESRIRIREEENYARGIYGHRQKDKESYFNLFFNTVAPKPFAAGWR